MQTTGHHTCSAMGSKEEVLKKAPFLSESSPFLGAGYYFWDDNLEMAHLWGEWHYNNSYYILEGKISCQDEDLFDLIGKRKHLKLIRQWHKKLSEYNPKANTWTIGQLIMYMREVDQFPFKLIKAVDSTTTRKRLPLGKNKGFVDVDPRIMICIVKDCDALLQKTKLI